MRRVLPVALALALASCTSGTPKPTAHGTPTPTGAAPAASASATRSLVLAVTRRDTATVSLYRVGEARTAMRVANLDVPGSYFTTYGITISAGQRPDVCVVWSADEPEGDGSGREAVYCYAGLSTAGVQVPIDGQPDEIALDPEATRLFWSIGDPEADTLAGVVADYSAGHVTRQVPFSMDCSRYLLAALWAGRERLVLHCTSGDSDDPGFLVTEELGGGSNAPHEGHRIGPDETFVWPGYADETSVLALERRCRAACGTEAPKMLSERAVRVELSTGKVLEVIATPAKGRFLNAVTGGAHGIVYVTDAEGDHRDVRVYLRWPGEKHGTLITGLPADVETVVAQP